jgi:lysyl-tRNA synthetase class 2
VRFFRIFGGLENASLGPDLPEWFRTVSMSRVALESSVFASARYFPRKRTLELEFSSGAVYRYFDFSPQEYDEFLRADSKGGYFSRNIRDRFRCQQIRPPYRIARRPPSRESSESKTRRASSPA